MRRIRITERATGESVIYEDAYDYTGDEYATAEESFRFMWEEGNFACDCNRELLFRRAKGEDVMLKDMACGEGRFVVEFLGECGR